MKAAAFLFSALLLCAGIFCLGGVNPPHFKHAFADGESAPGAPSIGQSSNSTQYPPSGGGGGGGGGSSCSAWSALAVRMDGTENTVATSNLICGLVTDGVYSLLDGLYVGATNNLANSELNWAQNAFNLTKSGTVAFTANQGWTGDGSTGVFDTGFNPNTAVSPQFGLNTAMMAACQLNSRTAAQNYVSIGAAVSIYAYIQPQNSGGLNYDLNGATFNADSGITDAQGSFIVDRPNSSGLVLYKNGSSVATPSDAAGGSQINTDISILAINTSGTQSDWSQDQIAYAAFGNSLTGTQALAFRNDLHTYMNAVNGSGC